MSVTTEPTSLTIASRQGDYAVEFPSTVAETIERVVALPHAVFLVDRNIAALYATELQPILERPHLLVDAVEDTKTLDGVRAVVDWLQELGSTRQTVLVAVGGGIVQDLATFSSHIYYRGIDWVYVPTTLLSMSDSCIGAKCGINLGAYKNQLGVLHAPRQVLICTAFVSTLSEVDVRSGYGEILKLMITGSEAAYEKLRRIVDEDGLRGPRLPGLLRDSLEIKKVVIEEDEYESDLRRILNYGHTFGHALESLTDHEVPHGLGVAWGVDVANFLSERRGYPVGPLRADVHDFVVKYLPCSLKRPVTAEELVAAARRDKKVEDGMINLILVERPGQLRIVPTPFDDQLLEDLRAYLAHSNAFDSV